jgi:hypothetical protein
LKNLVLNKSELISAFDFTCMKKVLFGLLLVVVGVVVVYFLMPASSSVSANMTVMAPQSAVYRCLTDGRLLQKWWRGSKVTAKNASKSVVVSGDAFRFVVTPNPFNVVSITMEQGSTPVQSFITMVPLPESKTEVIWKAELPAGGLFARIRNYGKSRALNRNMEAVLQRLQAFLQSEENVYGFPIKHEMVTDTLLVVTKQLDTVKPSVETYYRLINTLHEYIARSGAQEVNYPMLNISRVDSLHYQTMVAIPVNKPLPGSGAVLAKRMVPGNILVAEVRGGMATVEDGFRQLDAYVSEHHTRPPGLPFQSLVTDRRTEPDTSKWVTKLYYPIL